MSIVQKSLIVLLLVTLAACQTTTNSTTVSPGPSLNLDLDKAEDNLLAFVKTRASLAPDEEVIYYANGTIYGFVEGERDKPLLGFEMYNIGKVIKTGDYDYDLLTNEVLLYTDLETGAVLETFKNPYTEEEVEVVHVWNSPVNQKFALEGRFGKWGVSHQKYGEDVICLNADIFLAYPSPLTVSEYPKNSQADLYEAAELFQFFISEKQLNDPKDLNIDATISWTRIGPWLPWLQMGQRQGNMVYQAAGYKLLGRDYNDMPATLTTYVLKNHPEYRHAPAEYTSPNETSWTYFKKLKGK